MSQVYISVNYCNLSSFVVHTTLLFNHLSDLLYYLIISTRYVEGNMCIEQTQKALHKGIILLLYKVNVFIVLFNHY